MYKNIGKKIKMLAKVMAIILTVLAVIMGIFITVTYCKPIVAQSLGYVYDASYKATVIIIAVLIVLVIAVVNWLTSWCLYGFGELIDNTAAIKKQTKQQVPPVKDNAPLNIDQEL